MNLYQALNQSYRDFKNNELKALKESEDKKKKAVKEAGANLDISAGVDIPDDLASGIGMALLASEDEKKECDSKDKKECDSKDVKESDEKDLDEEAKGLEDQLKQTTDPKEKKEIQARLDEIKKLLTKECDGSTNLKESMYSSIDGVTDAMYSGDKIKVVDLIKKSKGDTAEGVKEAASCLHQMTAFNGSGPSSYKELMNILTKEFPEATEGDFKWATLITQKDDSGNYTTKYRAFKDFPDYEYFDECDSGKKEVKEAETTIEVPVKVEVAGTEVVNPEVTPEAPVEEVTDEIIDDSEKANFDKAIGLLNEVLEIINVEGSIDTELCKNKIQNAISALNTHAEDDDFIEGENCEDCKEGEEKECDTIKEAEVKAFKVTRIAPSKNAFMIEAETTEGLKYFIGKNYDKESHTLDEAEEFTDKAKASDHFKSLLK